MYQHQLCDIARAIYNVTDRKCLGLFIYFLSALIPDQLQMVLFVLMSVSRYTNICEHNKGK